MDEEPPEDERTIEEKHRNAIINELLRAPLCEKLIWLPIERSLPPQGQWGTSGRWRSV